MRTPALAAAVALLAVAACEQANGPAPEYRPEESGTVDEAMCLLGFTAVPLREVATGHHLVTARINGQSGSFVLDTGANVTVVDAPHARRFGLSRSGRPGGSIGVGGTSSASQVRIDSFEIGAMPIRQSRVVSGELGQLLQALTRASGTPVYGIIGQDVLKEHRAIIDVAKPMLYLIEKDSDPAPVPAERCRGDDDAERPPQ